MFRKTIYILLVSLFVVPSKPVQAQIDVSKLGGMVGWSIAADTEINGEFEGPDFDKVVKLANGWVIEFEDYDYFYEYQPEIVIFTTQFRGVTLYKAAIDGGDDIYDIRRVH